MKKIFLLIFCFFSSFMFSQHRFLDELTNPSQNFGDEIEQEINSLLSKSEYYLFRDFKKSFTFIKQAQKLNETDANINLLDYINLAYANYYYEIGDFTTATEKVYLLLDNFHKAKDAQSIRKVKNLIAKIERENDNFKKGLEICDGLISEIISEQPSLELGAYNLNAANISMNLRGESFLKAKTYLDNAFDNFDKKNSRSGKGMVYVKYARFYKIKFLINKNKEDFDLALNYAHKSLSIFNELNMLINVAYANYTIATTYSINGDHTTSIDYYENALKHYQVLGDLVYSLRIKQHLFVAYSILNKQEQAIKANNEYVVLKDSIFNIEKRRLIADSQTKFETEKVKKEKEIAEINSAKSQSLFIGSAIIAGLILLTSLFYYGRLKATKKAELITLELKETQKRLALEKQYRQSELKALKAQMDPHFIFNALNSIQEYIVLNQKNLASDYLGKFADLMRKYLHHSDKGSISIQEEIDCLNTYLELEKVRFEDSLNYTINVADNLDKEQSYIPTMIIQPYVENALKHGLLHKKTDRKLAISISKKDHCINCVVEDNGIGRARSKAIQEKRKKHHASFATNATQSRLDLLNYNKTDKIGIDTIDVFDDNQNVSGTKVTMTIPLFKV